MNSLGQRSERKRGKSKREEKMIIISTDTMHSTTQPFIILTPTSINMMNTTLPRKTNEEVNKSDNAEARIGGYCTPDGPKEKKLLPSGYEPSSYSVIIGRGHLASNHVGNRRLSVLGSSFLPQYIQAGKSRGKKSRIVSQLIAMFQEANTDGFAFVRHEDDQWWEADTLSIREKVGTVFRNLLHENYKSSTKSKVVARRQRKQKQKKTCLVQNGHEDLSAVAAVIDHPVMKYDSFTTIETMDDGDHRVQIATLDSLSCYGIRPPPKRVSASSCESSTTADTESNDPNFASLLRNLAIFSDDDDDDESPYEPLPVDGQTGIDPYLSFGRSQTSSQLLLEALRKKK